MLNTLLTARRGNATPPQVIIEGTFEFEGATGYVTMRGRVDNSRYDEDPSYMKFDNDWTLYMTLPGGGYGVPLWSLN